MGIVPGQVPDPATSSLVDGITASIRAAPELATAPGLAVPIAQAGGDVAGNAQAVAHVSNQAGLQRAVQSVHPESGFGGAIGGLFHSISHYAGDAISGVGKGIGFVGKIANKGLSEVQHEYRYLHDVEATHGAGAALLEGLAIAGAAAGAVAGVAAAPFTAGTSLGITAGILGAEGGAFALGHIAYKDSWQRTATGNYLDPHTHQPVSIGRDFASVIGEKPGTGIYKFTSGVGDAIGDLTLDPLARVGTVAGVARKAATIVREGKDVIDVVDRSPRVARAFDQIAKSDALTVAQRYPQFAGLAQPLGAASTRDEVVQVFRNALNQNELRNRALPALDLTAIPVQKMRQALADTRLGRGQTLLAQHIEEGGKSISNTEMPLEGTGRDLAQSAVGMHRWLKANGASDADARTTANNLLNAPDIRTRRNLWANAEIMAVKAQAVRAGMSKDAASLLSDEDIQRRLGELTKTVHGANVGDEVAYGAGPVGTELPQRKYADDLGTTATGAVLLSQRGTHTLPDLSALRQAGEAMANSEKLYYRAKGFGHKVDDWTWRHFTGNYFRRVVLLTGSFAGHVAFSENVLNSLRLGAANMAKDRLAATVGKLSTRYGGDASLEEAASDPEVQRSIGAYVGHLLGKSKRAVGSRAWNLTPERAAEWERAKSAHMLATTNDSHIVSNAVDASHSENVGLGGPESVYETGLRKIGNNKAWPLKSTGEWTVYGPGDDYYGEQTRAWGTWLKKIAQDRPSVEAVRAYKAALDSGASVDEASQAGAAAATTWLRRQDPHFLAGYDASQVTRVGWEHMDPLEAWGHEIMLNARGATTGQDGTLHHDLIEALAGPRGFKTVDNKRVVDTPAMDRITQQMLKDKTAKPVLTPGQKFVPAGTFSLERLSQAGFRKIGEVINFLSREPAYLDAFHRYRMQLWPKVTAGQLSEEDAITKAQTWATEETIKFIHNTHEKTVLSEAVHNFAPFWFAQQQAYKRVGRLLLDNPGAFRKYQLMVSALHNTVTQTTAANGNNYLTFPGSGFLGQGVPQAMGLLGIPVTGSSPVQFAGSLDSATYVMPGVDTPTLDFGPVAAVPVKAIAQLFPELRPAATGLLGGAAMNASIWDQVMPNSVVQKFLQAVNTDTRGFQSTWLATMQTLKYEQDQADAAWQAGGRKGPDPAGRYVPLPNASPLVMQDFVNRVKNQTRINYFVRALLGMTPIPLAPEVQVNDFGMKAEVNAAIKKAGSVTGGVDAFLKANPNATAFTVWQSDQPAGTAIAASREAENWVNANMGLIHDQRYSLAAAWFMPQLTDTKYDSGVYNEQMAQGLREKRAPMDYLKQLYVAAGDQEYYGVARPWYEQALKSGQYDASQLRTAFSNWTKSFGAQNPLWYDDFQSKDRYNNRINTLNQVDALLASKDAPQGYMADDLRVIMGAWHSYNNAVATSSGSKTALADAFQAYLVSVMQSNPELKAFISSVLGPVTSISGASFAQAEAVAAQAAVPAGPTGVAA